MTGFVRMRDGDGTDRERALLDSAMGDAPSAEARRRTLFALGLSAGAASALAPAVAHAAVKGASGKTASAVTALVVTKWLGTGAAIGAITAACIATATTPGLLFRESPPPAAVSGKARPEAPPRRDVPAHPAEAVPPALEVTAPAEPPHAAFAPARGTGAAEEPARETAPAKGTLGSSNLVEEVASLDRARAALAAGDASQALARLAAHARRFPGGALEQEAVVLRVRALRELGKRAEAERLARDFLAAHPESPQAPRVRALVGLSPR